MAGSWWPAACSSRYDVAIPDAELYDPARGSWTTTTPLPEPRERASVVTLADGSVLLVGGDRGYIGPASTPWCPEPIAAAVRYVPANLASFPEPTPRPAAFDVAKSEVPRASAAPAQAAKAAASINAFGLDLYRRMLADGTLDPAKGAVFSPTSIAIALAMARAGARGETAAQMDKVMHSAGADDAGRGDERPRPRPCLEERNVPGLRAGGVGPGSPPEDRERPLCPGGDAARAGLPRRPGLALRSRRFGS